MYTNVCRPCHCWQTCDTLVEVAATQLQIATPTTQWHGQQNDTQQMFIHYDKPYNKNKDTRTCAENVASGDVSIYPLASIPSITRSKLGTSIQTGVSAVTWCCVDPVPDSSVIVVSVRECRCTEHLPEACWLTSWPHMNAS